LAEYSLTWNDLPTILAAIDDSTTGYGAAPAPPPSTAPAVNVLDLILVLVEQHIGLTPEQRRAVALWILHTWVFDRFTFTPRLALLSPVRGCGKTTLLVLLELVSANGYRSDNITAAAIYHLLGRRKHTLCCDEGDNLGLLKNAVLKSVFNAGHRRGGAVDRFMGGWTRKFVVFAPLAVAAIGTLPLPLMHRSVTINMQRRAGRSAAAAT
jgi:hypothetical protein